MVKFELTENNLKILEVFLSRTELKWSEVSAYNELIRALSSPIDTDKNKQTNTST